MTGLTDFEKATLDRQDSRLAWEKAEAKSGRRNELWKSVITAAGILIGALGIIYQAEAESERLRRGRELAVCADIVGAAAVISQHSWRSSEHERAQAQFFQLAAGAVYLIRDKDVHGETTKYATQLADLVKLRLDPTKNMQMEKEKVDPQLRIKAQSIAEVCRKLL